jgi:hypothetical protein
VAGIGSVFEKGSKRRLKGERLRLHCPVDSNHTFTTPDRNTKLDAWLIRTRDASDSFQAQRSIAMEKL